MGKILGFFAAILLVVGLAFFGFKGCSGSGFGTGDGTGSGKNESTSSELEKEEYDEDELIIVKVKETDIFLDDEKCTDIDDMIDKISTLEAEGNKRKYAFDDEYAIKSVADDVSNALANLVETLDIKVDFDFGK